MILRMTAATDPPIEIAIADARMTNLVQQAKGRGSKTLVTTRNIAKVGAWSMVSTPFIIPPVGVAVMTRFMCVDRMLGQSGHRFGPELTGLSAEAFCGGGAAADGAPAFCFPTPVWHGRGSRRTPLMASRRKSQNSDCDPGCKISY